MRSSSLLRLVLAGLLLVPIALPVVTFSQALTLPPSGGNQPSSVIQAIGSSGTDATKLSQPQTLPPSREVIR